jgi:hypothetical protein
MRLPERSSSHVPEKRRPRTLSESRPPLSEIEILSSPELPWIKPVNAWIRTDGIRKRDTWELPTPAARQVHVDDGREGSSRAVSVAADRQVVVAVVAPEAGVVAAVAAGDCVAA